MGASSVCHPHLITRTWTSLTFVISYTAEQMRAVEVAHRNARTWSDYVALGFVRTLRWGLDLATGYRHDEAVAKGQKDPAAAKKKNAMTERKWLIR